MQRAQRHWPRNDCGRCYSFCTPHCMCKYPNSRVSASAGTPAESSLHPKRLPKSTWAPVADFEVD
jgi:hypothetical protein